MIVFAAHEVPLNDAELPHRGLLSLSLLLHSVLLVVLFIIIVVIASVLMCQCV